MNNFAILLLFIGGLGLTLGDVIMKKWVVSSNHMFYVVGMIAYVIAIGFLAESFKYKNFAVANAICVGFNIIALAIVSWLYFKEALSLAQVLGIGLVVVGIVVLELF